MTVKDLIEELQKLDQSKCVIPQVVAEDGSAWNCWIEVNDIPQSSLVQIKLSHSELKSLRESKVKKE